VKVVRWRPQPPVMKIKGNCAKRKRRRVKRRGVRDDPPYSTSQWDNPTEMSWHGLSPDSGASRDGRSEREQSGSNLTGIEWYGSCLALL